MNLKRIFHDNGTWPDAIHQFVFGDERAGGLRQNLDDLESTATYRHGGAKDPKFAAANVNLALL